MKNYINDIAKWIKEEVHKSNTQGVIVAVSGGIDSCVLSLIAKKAFPNNTLAIWIGIESNKKYKDQALSFLKENEIEYINLELDDTFHSLLKEINGSEFKDLTRANIKPRLRMLVQYAFASEKQYLVLSSTNKLEYYLGYFTKWGDGAADLYPLISFTKSEIKEMAKILNINEKIINSPPSADLYENQVDEDEFGFTYNQLEEYFLNDFNTPNNIKMKIQKFHNTTEHKRKNINYFKKIN